MSKLWLIFKREYLIRVKKKSFIIATILTPLAIAVLAIGSGVVAALGAQSKSRILVVDESGIFESSTTDKDNLEFVFSDMSVGDARSSYPDSGFTMLVHIPPFDDLNSTRHDLEYWADAKPSILLLERIESTIALAFREYKIDQSNIDRGLYDSFRTRISLESSTTSEGDDSGSGKLSAIIGTALGAVMGILMYIVILIYGQMVMRSVMEEKISRIAEVIISSVKPFQLMLGKILGVGAVGLTQLAIWIVLIPVVLMIVPLLIPGADPAPMSQMTPEMEAAMQQAQDGGFDINVFIDEFFRLNWGLILPSFVIFFLGGYFIYSSVFAAIGSAVDEDLGEAQQFMFPIIIPVILAFVIMMSSIESPNSPISVFGSIFPLFSPIIMPARLPFDPPIWQVILSLALLIGTTLFFIWFSARIYRVGILMYGKKVTFKELWKWMTA